MPYFIDRQLNIYTQNPVIKLPEFKPSYLVCDTEFTKYFQKLILNSDGIYVPENTKKFKKLIVDCIGIYLPELIPDYLVVFTYDELTTNFHPLISSLQAFGYNIMPDSEDRLKEIIEQIQEQFNELVDCEKSTRKVKKQFCKLITDGCFDHHLADLNIKPESLLVEKDKNSGSFAISVIPPKLDWSFLFFYGFADLFKIWGKDYQHLLLNSHLVQQRCLKLRNAYGSEMPMTEYNLINGMLYQFDYRLREAMYRFPPRSKGLDAQTSIFEVETRKINVKTSVIAKAIGFENLTDVMENFSHFLKTMPEKALPYHATDIFATWDLHLKQQTFYDVILKSFEMEPIEVADTTGSNVSKFIVECLKKEYGVNDKESEKFLQKIINLGQLDNLENSPLNDFGCQPFLTVGGLLYTRMAKKKLITGILSDCDLKSCYASSMSNMCVYLGEAITLTCKYDKYKMTLREALELVENQKAPDDGWFIRVSGMLEKAINTLVLSDLKFKPKSVKQQALYEVSDNRKSIEKFNAFKTSKKSAQSTILTKQIKFGLITKATIEALKKLPAEWYEEYLELKCDVVSFFPGDLIANNIDEYFAIRETLPEHDRVEKFDIKSGTKEINSQRYKNNVALRFDIGKYWVQLKNNRAKFKKAKNPIQEVFKLFQNSGYGVLACLYLTTNNLMASNQITADARAGAWLMTNALNGFGAITDGTSFDWEHLPLGLSFHEIIARNPSYLEHFDDSINSGIEITNNFDPQAWMDKNLNQHLQDFYQVNTDDYNLKRFEYELKTEVFPTTDGDEWLNNVKQTDELKYELGVHWDSFLKDAEIVLETSLFTKFYNNNSGNYCKGHDGGEVLVNGEEFDLVESEPFVKARSFQGGDNNLINWYCDAIKNGYKQPLIYSENKLIKFGDGNLLAIKFLESGSEHIAHPMGFDTVAYKMMKLVTRSQFLFQTELQLKNFETNEETLANLSKEIGLANKLFWDKLTANDIAPYDIELRDGVDYFSYAKGHPVGIGFELLALAPTAKGDINLVRQKIVELINEGCKNFNAALALSRNLKYGQLLKYLFASVIIAKKNAEDDLQKMLENSAEETTLFSVKPENIRRLHELTNNCTDDE